MYHPLVGSISQHSLFPMVFAPGGSAPGGVYAPGGSAPDGGCIPACNGAEKPEQNSPHTLLKILPCPNFVVGGNYIIV